MRITGNVVETVAKYAEEFTDGAFRYQGAGSDIGHGARYIDGIRMKVWVGRGASQEAAAYYVGALLGWARQTGTNIPDHVCEYAKAVQEAYQRNIKAVQSQREGEADAVSRAERQVSRPARRSTEERSR